MFSTIYPLLLVVWLILTAFAFLAARPKGLKRRFSIALDTAVATALMCMLILGLINLVSHSMEYLRLSSDVTVIIAAACALRLFVIARQPRSEKKSQG